MTQQLKSPGYTTKTRILSCIPVILFISTELLRSFIRPVYGKSKYGSISNILGWLPNFIAALAIISLGGLVIILIDHYISRKLKLLLLMTISIVAFCGLTMHEITQRGTGLYYDTNDIYATIAGTLLGFVCYYFIVVKEKVPKEC